MAIVVCNAGELRLLDLALKTALSVDEPFTLRLFKNDYTPIATSAVGDLTEADFTDYTAKTLNRSGWSASTTITGAASITYGTAQTWTCGATGNTVYGAYVLDGSGNLVWAERFAEERVLVSSDTITYTPTLTLASAN